MGRHKSPNTTLPMADTQESGGRRGEAVEGGGKGVLEKLGNKEKIKLSSRTCRELGEYQEVWKAVW